MKITRVRGHFNSYGWDHLATTFTVSGVERVVADAKRRGYKEVVIVRNKPVFGRDKFVWTVNGK